MPPDLRLRDPSPDLLALPWELPLEEWEPTEVPLRDIPVGPSRHLVRFVELPRGLLAIKEMSGRLAAREYELLRRMKALRLPSVDPVGVVDRRTGPDTDSGLLVTRFLDRSWQYRRLFRRLPQSQGRHRERLLDAMASLLVELHRRGVFWGDCSLANTLFVRDGQLLQAYLVDAETAEMHPGGLSDGQRELDLSILTENVTFGLFDVAARLGDVDEEAVLADASSVAQRYRDLWDELHRTLVFDPGARWQVEAQLRRLAELGFAVDEVRVEPDGEQLRLTTAVAGRSWHSEELRGRTGLTVGEGQAQVLLNDLVGWTAARESELARPSDARHLTSGLRKDRAARSWLREVYEPGLERVGALADVSDPVQALCDLFEVRWLLSEEAGHDVGDDAALAGLSDNRTPHDSMASTSVVEAPTQPMAVVSDDDEDDDW